MTNRLKQMLAVTGALIAVGPRMSSAKTYKFKKITDGPPIFTFVIDLPPSVNDAGVAAFVALSDSQHSGLFGGRGTEVALADYIKFQVAANNNVTGPTPGSYVDSRLAFAANTGGLTGAFGIFSSDGISEQTIFSNPSCCIQDMPAMNADGSIVWFQNNEVVTAKNGTVITLYKAHGIPDFRFVSGNNGSPDINNFGDVVFQGALRDEPDASLYRGNGGSVTRIFQDTDVRFLTTDLPYSLNNQGAAVFRVDNPSEKSKALLVGSGGNVITVADTTMGKFRDFTAVAINDSGTVAFLGILAPLADLSANNGIFTGPDPVADKVVAVGDSLFGSTVTNVRFAREGLNKNGQIAFQADLADHRRVIALASPEGHEIHWAAATDGSYNDPSKWNPPQVPVTDSAAVPPRTDIAIFDQAGGYTITSPTLAGSERALVRNGLPTLQNFTYVLSAISPTEPSLAVGQNGVLTILNGAIAAKHVTIGDLPGAPGSLNIFDSVVSAQRLVIGGDGPGNLSVVGSSTLSSTESLIGNPAPGIAVVDSTTAQLGSGDLVLGWTTGNLAIGNTGPGSLTVQGGGKIIATGAFLGVGQAGIGTLLVQGIGADGLPSQLTTKTTGANVGDLVVGGAGTGRVELKAGGHIFAQNLLIGSNNTASGKVLISGSDPSAGPSHLDALGDTTVGGSGVGNLRVESGGLLSSHTVKIAAQQGLLCLAEIDGAGSLWGTENLTVGEFGEANLVISNDGHVATQNAVIGKNAGADGTVLVLSNFEEGQAAPWLVRGNLEVAQGGEGRLSVLDGRVQILRELFVGGDSSAGLTGPGTVRIDQFAIVNVGVKTTVRATGKIEGSGFFVCPFTNLAQGGFIDPRLRVVGSVATKQTRRKQSADDSFDAPGRLTFEGDLELSTGSVLRIDVAGTGEGQSDVLAVTGNVALGGNVEARFLDGFLPKKGDNIDFLEVTGDMMGQFDEISFPELAPGFDADLKLTSDGKLRLTARTDAAVGDGASIAPPADLAREVTLTKARSLCGASTAAVLPFTLAGLGFMKRRRGHSPHYSLAPEVSEDTEKKDQKR